MTASETILFFQQLAALHQAGMSLTNSIHLLIDHCPKQDVKLILKKIHQDLLSGKQLAVSLAKHPEFDLTICYLINAGEKSGKLTDSLLSIAKHQTLKREIKKQLKQALTYPLFLIIISIIMTLCMLIFVVPQFVTLFQNLSAKLPAFTLAIINLSTWMRNNGIYAFLLTLLLLNVIFYSRRIKGIRAVFDRLTLKFPILGSQFKKNIQAQLCRTIALLYSAGLPITEIIKLTMHTIKNTCYRRALEDLLIQITKGKSLNSALQYSSLFSPLVIQLIKVGEESGTLEQMLEKAAEFYEADIQYFISQLSRFIEPLIMLILGVLIGGLIIAMYLPIFKLGSAL